MKNAKLFVFTVSFFVSFVALYTASLVPVNKISYLIEGTTPVIYYRYADFTPAFPVANLPNASMTRPLVGSNYGKLPQEDSIYAELAYVPNNALMHKLAVSSSSMLPWENRVNPFYVQPDLK